MTSVFPTPGIGRGDKNPSRARIVSVSFGSSHSLESSGLRENLLWHVRKQNSPLQDAQKVQTSHLPNPGAPKRALSSEGLPTLYTFLRGVAEAALYCAHRATTASSWGLYEQKGTWPLPPTFQHPATGFGYHSSTPVPTHR